MKKWFNKVTDFIKNPEVKKQVIKDNNNDLKTDQPINSARRDFSEKESQIDSTNDQRKMTSSSVKSSHHLRFKKELNSDRFTRLYEVMQQYIITRSNSLNTTQISQVSNENQPATTTTIDQKMASSLNNQIATAENHKNIDFNYYFKELTTLPSVLFEERINLNQRIDITSNEMTDLLINSKSLVNEKVKAVFCIALIGFHHKKGTIVIH